MAKTGPKPRTAEQIIQQLFAGSIRTESGCLLWQGHSLAAGYGLVCFNAKQVYAHRFVYQILVGDIPEGYVVAHHCDNPGCVEPTHLFCGTHADNVADKVNKKRHCFGEGQYKSKLTDEAVRHIKLRVMTSPEYAKLYGVSSASIRQIWVGKSWKHVT